MTGCYIFPMSSVAPDRQAAARHAVTPPGWARCLLFVLMVLLLLAGCSSQPKTVSRVPEPQDKAPLRTAAVVETALAQLDRPYRYGGHNPRGFDCSGLVYYSYARHGIGIPRTTHEQQRSARPVPLREIAPGDLLFFREVRQKASHVGLYVGGGRFIHASTSQQSVRLSQLGNPYWQKHLIGAGRY